MVADLTHVMETAPGGGDFHSTVIPAATIAQVLGHPYTLCTNNADNPQIGLEVFKGGSISGDAFLIAEDGNQDGAEVVVQLLEHGGLASVLNSGGGVERIMFEGHPAAFAPGDETLSVEAHGVLIQTMVVGPPVTRARAETMMRAILANAF